MKNNNTKMGTLILKLGNFTLKHLVYCGIYILLYKDSPIWGGDFNELFDTRLRDYVFEREPDPKKAVEFFNELHKWGFSLPGTLEKMLEEDYGEKI